MALIQCSECKGKVSDKALICPHCGFGMAQNIESLLLKQKTRSSPKEISDEPAALQTHVEKRAHKRIDIKMIVRINQEVAILFNISKSGIKLAIPYIPKDHMVDITMDNGEKVFIVKGTIRWVSSKRSFSNLIDIGVEISEAPPEYYKFIDQLLAKN